MPRKKQKMREFEPYEIFAMLYPHEAARRNWRKFSGFLKDIFPGVTDKDIRRTLRETGGLK